MELRKQSLFHSPHQSLSAKLVVPPQTHTIGWADVNMLNKQSHVMTAPICVTSSENLPMNGLHCPCTLTGRGTIKQWIQLTHFMSDIFTNSCSCVCCNCRHSSWADPLEWFVMTERQGKNKLTEPLDNPVINHA